MISWLTSAIVLVYLAAACAGTQYLPKNYYHGTNVTTDGLTDYSGKEIILNASSPVLTLDYGFEVGGFPFLEVDHPGSPLQVELKYSEPFHGLELPYGDGPWLYTNGLMNSFRTETFNISEAGKIESFFIQGGLRWQSITLLTNSSLKIRKVGIRPSVQVSETTGDLRGAFSTSNDIYNKVWDLGVRAVQAACVEAKSQPSTWEVTREGAFIRGQYPAVSAKGNNFSLYTLEFHTKITAGGTGWRVAGGANGGYGAYFVLTSSGPALGSQSIPSLPRNQLTAAFGFSLIQQQILPSSETQVYNVSIPVDDNKWYKITTAINETGYSVFVDDKPIAFVENSAFESYANEGWGSGTLTSGTFGFGPFLNQAAWFKDVQVRSQDGSIIYSNSLTSEAVLEEYAVATNKHAACLDGPKRDRVVWIGDYVHTGRSMAVATGRYDIAKSMIDFEFDWQYPPGPAHGLVPIQALMGAGKEFREAYYPSQFGETDYQFFFMLAVGDYFAITRDISTMKKSWEGTKLLVQTLADRYIDPSSNLMANSVASWFTAQGAQNATAPTALFVAALDELTNVAYALGDKVTAKSWTGLSKKIRLAVDSLLWNESLGAYSLSLANANESAILATAFTIRAGIASSEQASKSIEKLADVFLKIGYKDNSAASNDASTQLSPNTQGFLFESLFLAHLRHNVSSEIVLPSIRNLAEVFWPKMAVEGEYYTGATWEYLYQDGSPGIGIFTSLSHPWGSAATYVYTNYILGVRSEWVESRREYDWVFEPAWEIVEGLGLKWAKGRVPLFDGGHIEAEWAIRDGKPSMRAKVVGSRVKVITKHKV